MIKYFTFLDRLNITISINQTTVYNKTFTHFNQQCNLCILKQIKLQYILDTI